MEFATPTALATLLLPALVLALAFAPRRPQRAATGALELWRRVARELPRGGVNRSWRPPAWIVAVTVGLIAWSGALAAPRLGEIESEEWHAIVDRRPHMLLEIEPGRTRLAAVLEATTAALRERRGDVRVRWSSPGLADLVTRAREPAPIEHFAAAPVAARAPDFAAFDGAGVLWLTSAPVALEALRAGRLTSGGAAVPGFVAASAGGWLHWDGEELETRDAPQSGGRVLVDGDVPRLVREFAGGYARARGFEIEATSTAPLRLAVVAAPTTGDRLQGAHVVAGGRRVARLDDGAVCVSPVAGVVAIEAELDGGARVPLATAVTGVLHVAPGDWRELDATDFALGLGAVFDLALAPDARLVPVDGRRDQGEAVLAFGESPPPTPTPLELRPQFGLAAALLFALAAWLRRR